jgi:hypothetical protein
VSVLSSHRPPQPPIGVLLGVWTTDNPAYAGRRLEIHKDHIAIAFDNDDTAYTEAINGVELQPHDGQLSFTIHTISYDTTYQPKDEHPAEWRLDYSPANGGTLRLAHQPNVVWKKIASKH